MSGSSTIGFSTAILFGPFLLGGLHGTYSGLEMKLDSVKESALSQGSEGGEEVRGFANLR